MNTKMIKAPKAPKRDISGNLIIESEPDAVKALDYFAHLKNEIAIIKAETELDLKEREASEISRTLANWMYEEGRMILKTKNITGNRIDRHGNKWIWDKEDIPNDYHESLVKPLRTILKRVFKKPEEFAAVRDRVTKRVVVPEAIDELVREGSIDAEQVAEAFITPVQTRYVKI